MPGSLPVGSKVPSLTLKTRVGGTWSEIKTDSLFAGKKVVVFGLPGAFTPTCSSSHVPRYVELKRAFAAAGVAEVVCVSVNDAFVMQRWQEEEKAQSLVFLPDGNGLFTKGINMLVDKSDLGFGMRSWRYAMVVEDGVIKQGFVEPDKPGDPFEVSDADTVLKAVGGTPPPSIVMFSRATCGFCHRAKAALEKAGLGYEELPAAPATLKALPGGRTTPQIYLDGKFIGGAEELDKWLAANKK